MQIFNKEVSPENIFFGRLMSPDEIQATTLHNKTVPEDVKQSWCLCGDTSREFYKLIQNDKEPVTFGISTFTTNYRFSFVLFTVQVRKNQTRFLVRLGDERLDAFLTSIETQGLTISFGLPDGDDAVLRIFELESLDTKPIKALCPRYESQGKYEDILELKKASAHAIKLPTVPSSFPGLSIEHVSLNVIVPDSHFKN